MTTTVAMLVSCPPSAAQPKSREFEAQYSNIATVLRHSNSTASCVLAVYWSELHPVHGSHPNTTGRGPTEPATVPTGYQPLSPYLSHYKNLTKNTTGNTGG